MSSINQGDVDDDDAQRPLLGEPINSSRTLLREPINLGCPLLGEPINSADDANNTADRRGGSHFTHYKTRWYILFIFSLFGSIEVFANTIWVTMSSSSKLAFDWTTEDITLLIFWRNAIPILATFPYGWLLQEKGLRTSLLVSSVFLLVGTGLRCVTSRPPFVTWLMNFGQIVTAFADIVVVTGAPLMAVTWFPPSQCIIVMAIVLIVYNLGAIVPNIVTPFVIPSDLNGSEHNAWLIKMFQPATPVAPEVETLRSRIMYMMYGQFGLAILLLLLIWAYFPAKPPTPPATSTTRDEPMKFIEGLKHLFKIPTFFVLSLVFCVTQGATNALYAVGNTIFIEAGFKQNVVDMVLFGSALTSLVVIFLVGLLASSFKTRLKGIMVVLYSTAAISNLWICLMFAGILPKWIIINLAIPVTLAISSTISAAPLFYDLACEISYPIGEGLTNAVFTLGRSPVSCVILLILLIPGGTGGGKLWLTWTVSGILVTSIIALIPIRLNFNRTQAEGAT